MQLPDPSEEAKRLLADPVHLRRKADYIEAQVGRGGPLEGSRRYRVKELRAQADALEADRRRREDELVERVNAR